MELSQNCVLQKDYLIDDKYKITFFLKKGSYAESYQVRDINNKIKFLKLIDYSKLNDSQIDEEGAILEIKILKNISHPNIVKYVDSNEIIINNKKYAYLVLDFISGETIADKMKRELIFSVFAAKQIILGVLNGINYLHTLPNPIIHDNVTNLNIMLDLSTEIPTPKIVGFGYTRFLHQSIRKFNKKGLNPFYMAPETFKGLYSQQSDIYSVGALFYHMLFGLPPWFVDISRYNVNINEIEEIILNERNRPLKFPNMGTSIDDQMLKVIHKALQIEPENRFKSAQEFILAIEGKIEVNIDPSRVFQRRSVIRLQRKPRVQSKGFDAIVGMEELKKTVKLDVIDALNEPQKYAEYGLSIPNGMLLYGPPGCGKTFFAEKIAEEIGFNFIRVNPADLASIYIHGTQKKIAELFREAKEKAPCVIFFDEVDALIPSRDDKINHSFASEVNEFLVHLSNASEDGIFVICATNQPEKIDKAALRTGRIDKIIYVPPPDFNLRKQLFKMYLENRPTELGLEFDTFAELTENYVSSDIKFICDEAARMALKNNTRIASETIINIIQKSKPSVTLSELKRYENIKKKMECDFEAENKRKRIGFI